MRLVIDTLIAFMLVLVFMGIVVHQRTQAQMLDRIGTVHHCLMRLHEQAILHGAMDDVATTDVGFPVALSPLWFAEEGLPANIMVPGRQPWLDIAPPGDHGEHPPDPVIYRPDQAGFWYNPNLGIFRARVPWAYSVDDAIELYNDLNGTDLLRLPTSSDPSRHPVLYHLLEPPTARGDSIKDWIDAGAAALGVGSALVKKDLIKAKDFKGLTALSKQFTEAVKAARGG